MLKLLVPQPCVRRYRHIETQSNHALTGAYVSNQSTNGGVRQQCVNGMVFIYIYTLSKQRWHFSLRESKAHIAMDIFNIYRKDTDERIRASCFEPSSSILYFNLLFLQKCVINH